MGAHFPWLQLATTCLDMDLFPSMFSVKSMRITVIVIPILGLTEIKDGNSIPILRSMMEINVS